MRGTQTTDTTNKDTGDIFATNETTPAEHSEYIDAPDLSMSMSLKLIDDRDGVSDGNAQPGKGYRSVGCKTAIKKMDNSH